MLHLLFEIANADVHSIKGKDHHCTNIGTFALSCVMLGEAVKQGGLHTELNIKVLNS